VDADDTSKGQSRFNFYLVALNFSILGLALQTYRSEKLINGASWEPAAWLCLLVSGLCALSYVEWASKKLDLNTVTERLVRVPSPVGEHLRALKIEHENLTKTLKRRRPPDGLKYGVAKWGFLAGVVILAVSRSLIGLHWLPA
jgi:hypothetical protein